MTKIELIEVREYCNSQFQCPFLCKYAVLCGKIDRTPAYLTDTDINALAEEEK